MGRSRRAMRVFDSGKRWQRERGWRSASLRPARARRHTMGCWRRARVSAERRERLLRTGTVAALRRETHCLWTLVWSASLETFRSKRLALGARHSSSDELCEAGASVAKMCASAVHCQSGEAQERPIPRARAGKGATRTTHVYRALARCEAPRPAATSSLEPRGAANGPR
jgi:hypothetical protein